MDGQSIHGDLLKKTHVFFVADVFGTPRQLRPQLWYWSCIVGNWPRRLEFLVSTQGWNPSAGGQWSGHCHWVGRLIVAFGAQSELLHVSNAMSWYQDGKSGETWQIFWEFNIAKRRITIFHEEIHDFYGHFLCRYVTHYHGERFGTWGNGLGWAFQTIHSGSVSWRVWLRERTRHLTRFIRFISVPEHTLWPCGLCINDGLLVWNISYVSIMWGQ